MTNRDESARSAAPPEVIAFLKARYPRSLNLLGLIRGGGAEAVEYVPGGVLVKGRSFYSLLATSREAADSLLGRIPWEGPVRFSGLPVGLARQVAARGTVSWREQFWLCYLPSDVRLPDAPASVRPLAPGDATIIQEHWPYGDESSVEYVRERIKGGITAGLRIDGELVAWGLTHTGGAMGFLHVLESHRGVGYAKAITYRLVREIRKRGDAPFVYISVRNEPSLGLAAGLGMVRVEQVEWMGLNEPDR